MKTQYLETIKKFEGFTAQAKWDFAQHSNGYGTKALYPGEVIDKVDAEHRFAAEVASARAAVQRFAPSLDEGTAAALTSLTFNAGPRWMNSGLGAAIKAGDLEGAKRVFVQYVHAGGQRLAGLEARRAAEVQWFGQSQSAGPEVAREVSEASMPQVAAATGKGTAELEDVRGVFAPTMPSRSDWRPSTSLPWPSDALTQGFLLETLSIILAAHRSLNDRDG